MGILTDKFMSDFTNQPKGSSQAGTTWGGAIGTWADQGDATWQNPELPWDNQDKN